MLSLHAYLLFLLVILAALLPVYSPDGSLLSSKYATYRSESPSTTKPYLLHHFLRLYFDIFFF